jgi:hypothetical protein
MKRINKMFATLTYAALKAAPLAVLFASFGTGIGSLYGQGGKICDGGSLVVSSAGIVGCAFSTWGPLEQQQCSGSGTTVFSGPDPKNCHICVLNQYAPQVAADNFTGLSLVPVQPAPNPPLDFHCLKCAPPPGGMTAWWTLDEPNWDLSVRDFTQNLQYDGVRYGASAVPGHDAPLGANVTNANHFNGSNQYLEVPAANTQLNVGPGAADGSGDFSIDAWVKIDPGTNASGVRVIVEKRTHLNSRYKGYSFYLYNQYLGLQLADDGTAPGYANYGAQALVVPADGQWHFVAVSVARKPGAFNVQFTLDSKAVVNVASPIRSGDLTNTSPLRIGMITIGTGSVFNGSIDEVEFFNRAVPSQDFQSIFNAKCYGKCKY